MMAMAFGTMKEGEAVRLDCLSRSFAADISEVRTSTGGLLVMVAVVTRGHVPRRELPPGERVTIYAADGSRWEGAIGGSMDSAASIILQQSTDDNRENYLWRAKLAQKFGKHDEMLAAVKEISSLHLDLTSEEKKIVTFCYNGLLKANWRILKLLKSPSLQNLQHVPTSVVTGFTERIGHQLLDQCNDAFCLIEEHLLPFSSETSMAFYYKLMGDISWLALEAESDDRDALVNKAVSYYEMAIAAMTNTNASCTDASFLEVILNLTALLNDEVDSKSRARTLALTAVAAASGKTLSSESKAVLDLLSDNLEIWSSHEQLVYQTLSVEQVAVLHEAIGLPPAPQVPKAEQVAVFQEVIDLPPAPQVPKAEQVAVLQEVINLPPAPQVPEAEQVAVLQEVIDLPPAPQVREAIGAQRAVPHGRQDFGVPLVFRHVVLLLQCQRQLLCSSRLLRLARKLQGMLCTARSSGMKGRPRAQKKESTAKTHGERVGYLALQRKAKV